MSRAGDGEARILAAFAQYRAAIEDWARRKPGKVAAHMTKLAAQAGVGNTAAALELAILDAMTEAPR